MTNILYLLSITNISNSIIKPQELLCLLGYQSLLLWLTVFWLLPFRCFSSSSSSFSLTPSFSPSLHSFFLLLFFLFFIFIFLFLFAKRHTLLAPDVYFFVLYSLASCSLLVWKVSKTPTLHPTRAHACMCCWLPPPKERST